MIGVTPVGIITTLPSESRRFYRDILGVERVQMVRSVESDGMEGMLLRLESPYLEVFSIETRLQGQNCNRIINRDFALQLRPPNVKKVLYRLDQEDVKTRTDAKGTIRFADVNGIAWEIPSEPDPGPFLKRTGTFG